MVLLNLERAPSLYSIRRIDSDVAGHGKDVGVALNVGL